MLMQTKVSMHVETVVKLSLKKDTPKIEVTMEPDDESNYTPEEKAMVLCQDLVQVKMRNFSPC